MNSVSARPVIAWIFLVIATASIPAVNGDYLDSSNIQSVAVTNASIGLNKFDLLQQFLGTASGGDGGKRYRKVTMAMGMKAISDAESIGVSYFRIAASGYAPSIYGQQGDLDLWLRNKTEYWTLFDRMLDEVNKHRMQVVPVLVWNVTQFPAMTGETVPQLLRNANSRSYLLLSEYVSELVKRYRKHPAILFYELTNELNLGADLDLLKRCSKKQPAPLCIPRGNYTTDDVVAFTGRLATLVKTLDSVRPISSGFSVPRTFSANLRKNPEWRAGSLPPPDTRADFQRYLIDLHASTDIISVHLYDTADNRRFGSSDAVDLLAIVKEAADRAGKPLFVGEFGDSSVHKASIVSFSDRMLDRLLELKVPFSAIWVWEFYQKNPYTTRDSLGASYSLEPGLTDYQIKRLKETNEAMRNNRVAYRASSSTIPTVILTWPLECTRIIGKQLLHAVASDDSGRIQRVEFWVGGKRIASDDSPPYETEVNTNVLPQGEYEAEARAFDYHSNVSAWHTRVVVGDSASVSQCTGAR